MQAKTRKRWTDEERRLLARHYPDTENSVLAILFGVNVDAIHNQGYVLGLKKSPQFLSHLAKKSTFIEKGKANRFQPGQAAWNKGMKGLCIGGVASQFKPGQMPFNHLPVGSEITDSDGYRKIKTAEPKTWAFVHRQVWEAAHGTIPKGTAVIFKDGDKQNCALENLQLLNRGELMLKNSIHNYPPELQQAIRAVNKLKRAIASAEGQPA